MKTRNFLKISLPAILLTVLVSGIAVISPLIVDKDPEKLTATTEVTPRSNFIADSFTFVLDIRFSHREFTVEPGDIEVDFRPLTLVSESSEKTSGRLVIRYQLRCLENPSCLANKSYPISDIIISYVNNDTEKVLIMRIRVEPIYISPRIDPTRQDFPLRFPKEPLVENNLIFFAGLIIVGFLLIVVWPLIRFFIRKRATRRASEEENTYTDKTSFLARLEYLKIMLANNSEPRLVLAQCDGIIADYLRGRRNVPGDSQKSLNVLQRQLQSMAYQEHDPSREEVTRKLIEISSVLVSDQEQYND